MAHLVGEKIYGTFSSHSLVDVSTWRAGVGDTEGEAEVVAVGPAVDAVVGVADGAEEIVEELPLCVWEKDGASEGGRGDDVGAFVCWASLGEDPT